MLKAGSAFDCLRGRMFSICLSQYLEAILYLLWLSNPGLSSLPSVAPVWNYLEPFPFMAHRLIALPSSPIPASPSYDPLHHSYLLILLILRILPQKISDFPFNSTFLAAESKQEGELRDPLLILRGVRIICDKKISGNK